MFKERVRIGDILKKYSLEDISYFDDVYFEENNKRLDSFHKVTVPWNTEYCHVHHNNKRGSDNIVHYNKTKQSILNKIKEYWAHGKEILLDKCYVEGFDCKQLHIVVE